MPVSAKEIMDCARRLADLDDEADRRASASRAYYSAFHALCPLVSMLPATSTAAKTASYLTHGEALARLADWKPSGNTACLKKLGTSAGVATRQMRACRETRELADYDLENELPASALKQHLLRSSDVFKFAIQAINEVERAATAA